MTFPIRTLSRRLSMSWLTTVIFSRASIDASPLSECISLNILFIMSGRILPPASNCDLALSASSLRDSRISSASPMKSLIALTWGFSIAAPQTRNFWTVSTSWPSVNGFTR